MITSLDFTTGTYLFCLFGLLCLKMKLSSTPVFGHRSERK